MRTTSRVGFSLALIAAFAAMAGASAPKKDGPPGVPASEGGPGGAERTTIVDDMNQLDGAHGKLAKLDAAGAPDAPCNAAVMSEKAKAGLDEYKRVKIIYLHGPWMARFASPNRADFGEDKSPWAWATDSSYR